MGGGCLREDRRVKKLRKGERGKKRCVRRM